MHVAFIFNYKVLYRRCFLLLLHNPNQICMVLIEAATLEVTLLPSDILPSGLDLASPTWEVKWKAAPVVTADTPPSFTCLIGSFNSDADDDGACPQTRHSRMLLTTAGPMQSGAKFHIPFSFHPPKGSTSLLQQEWIFSFSLFPLEEREEYVGGNTEFRIILTAEVRPS